MIHSTGRSGIWVRAIQTRTNLHKSILDRCLKSLEGKNYIKSVHNVKFPSRKMYMLAGLAPSEDVTGGAWFTDGVLDANFISTVAGYIEYTVSRKSWYEAPGSSGSGGASSSDAPRNKRLKTGSGGSVAVKQEFGDKKPYLPFPAGYQGYPTVAMITAAVNESGITPVRLGEESIVQLLEMLCYDNKLIALSNGEVYKSVKNPAAVKTAQARKPAAGPGSGGGGGSGAGADGADNDDDEDNPNRLAHAPCGQFPVFKLSAPPSAVNPEEADYFDSWLEKALGY